MSDPIDGTHGQTPEDVQHLHSQPRPTFAPGDAIPGLSSWILERKLGGGGFGEVWLARHAWNARERPRAVKFCTDPAAKHRLVTHEKNVVLRVMKYAGDHPNIVPLLDCNLEGEVPWLMYEYVEGGTLAGLIGEWRALPLPKRLGKAVRTLYAIAGALARCHQLSPPLVHRDMKPHNVLMADGKVPRITDFGIGSVVIPPTDGAATGALTAYAARVPTALQNSGTRLYAPPEQLFGSPPSPRDDVYALGIIAYQMILGDLLTSPGADATYELRDLKIPGELATLIVKSVAMNAERRPADATEWETVLGAIIQKARSQPEPEELPAPEPKGEQPEVWALDPDPTDPSAAPTDAGARMAATERPRAGPPPLPSSIPVPPAPPQPRSGKVPAVRPAPKKAPPAPRRGDRMTRWLTVLLLLCIPLLCVALYVVFVSLTSKPPEGPPEGENKTEPVSPAPQTDPKGTGPKKNEPEKKAEPDPKKPGGAPQKPGGELKKVEPMVSAPKPGEAREVEIAPGAKMTFSWVPPGTATLGSPADEKGRDDDEGEHGFTTNGFWLGKYEVTQAEWAAVMRDTPRATPSTFRVGGPRADRLGKVTDTGRFPVEGVSWNDCQEFLKLASAHGGVRKAFDRPGSLALPHEDEWEYACRGGQGNRRPFHFGDQLGGDRANCNGDSPYGAAAKGPALRRPEAVGGYAGLAPHPWGLRDMHGNVWEWCDNTYAATGKRVARGGSWDGGAASCRAAYRISSEPDKRFHDCGLRVCVRLD